MSESETTRGGIYEEGRREGKRETECTYRLRLQALKAERDRLHEVLEFIARDVRCYSLAKATQLAREAIGPCDASHSLRGVLDDAVHEPYNGV